MCNKDIKIKNIQATHYIENGEIVQFELTSQYYNNLQSEKNYIALQKNNKLFREQSVQIDKKLTYLCFPRISGFGFCSPYSYDPIESSKTKNYYFITNNNPLTMASIKNVSVNKENNIIINNGHYGNVNYTLNSCASMTCQFKTMPASDFELHTSDLKQSEIDEYAFTFNENVTVKLNGKDYKSGTPITKKIFESIVSDDGSSLTITCNPQKEGVLLVCGRDNWIVNGVWKTLDTRLYSPHAIENESVIEKWTLNRLKKKGFNYKGKVLELSFTDQFRQDVKIMNKIYQDKLAESPISKKAYILQEKFCISCDVLSQSNNTAQCFIVGEYKKDQPNTVIFVDEAKPKSMAILKDMPAEFAPFFKIDNTYQDKAVNKNTPLALPFESNVFKLKTDNLINVNNVEEYCLTFSKSVTVTVNSKAYKSGDVISQHKFKEIQVQADLGKSAILTFCKRSVQGSFEKFARSYHPWSVEKAWFHAAEK